MMARIVFQTVRFTVGQEYCMHHIWLSLTTEILDNLMRQDNRLIKRSGAKANHIILKNPFITLLLVPATTLTHSHTKFMKMARHAGIGRAVHAIIKQLKQVKVRGAECDITRFLRDRHMDFITTKGATYASSKTIHAMRDTSLAAKLDKRDKLLNGTQHVGLHRPREVNEHHHTMALTVRQSRQAPKDILRVLVRMNLVRVDDASLGILSASISSRSLLQFKLFDHVRHSLGIERDEFLEPFIHLV